MISNMESDKNTEIETDSRAIPDSVLSSLVDTFLPDIIAFFNTEEGRREYSEWQEKQKESLHSNVWTLKAYLPLLVLYYV